MNESSESPSRSPGGEGRGASAADAASRVLLLEAFAGAVADVEQRAREVAVAQCAMADAVERARCAGVALSPVDRSTGGPRWSPEMVVERVVVTELAAALQESEFDVRRRVETARALATDFVATRGALERGEISYRHAEKIVAHSVLLPRECLADYESRLLEIAGRVSVQRLQRHARAAVEESQAVTAIERQTAAAASRRVTLDTAADGMAYLTHFLPAVEAVAIYNRATDLAKSLKNGGDPRTLTQLRADSLADLMLNGETSVPGATRGIRPHVRVTVPVLELLGVDVPGVAGCAGPAVLEGYGPIDRLTALQLTRDAPTFARVLTDPITGCALTYGRTRYKPPADLDDLIRTVHTECTFPIDCSSSATAEIDHTTPWAEDGQTAFANSTPLCATHHKVKHHTEWKVEQDPGGTGAILWTSPAGFVYSVSPTPIAHPVSRAAPLAPPAPFTRAAPKFRDSATTGGSPPDDAPF